MVVGSATATEVQAAEEAEITKTRARMDKPWRRDARTHPKAAPLFVFLPILSASFFFFMLICTVFEQDFQMKL